MVSSSRQSGGAVGWCAQIVVVEQEKLCGGTGDAMTVAEALTISDEALVTSVHAVAQATAAPLLLRVVSGAQSWSCPQHEYRLSIPWCQWKYHPWKLKQRFNSTWVLAPSGCSVGHCRCSLQA